MYIYIAPKIHVYTHAQTNICNYIHRLLFMMYIHIYIYIYMYIYICIHLGIYYIYFIPILDTYIHIYIYTYIYMYISIMCYGIVYLYIISPFMDPILLFGTLFNGLVEPFFGGTHLPTWAPSFWSFTSWVTRRIGRTCQKRREGWEELQQGSVSGLVQGDWYRWWSLMIMFRPKNYLWVSYCTSWDGSCF